MADAIVKHLFENPMTVKGNWRAIEATASLMGMSEVGIVCWYSEDRLGMIHSEAVSRDCR